MGGNALKEFGAKRLPTDRFLDISGKLEIALNEIMQINNLNHASRMIPSYRDKEDHGDIDIVLPTSLRAILSDEEIGVELASRLGTNRLPYKANGGVVSYGIPLEEGGVFQADLIYNPEVELDFSVKYYAWNDVGNLIGRIAHKMGLRFGHNGLFLPLRDGNYMFDVLLVTRDFKTALEFLGFDYLRWEKGFNNLEEIFEFTIHNDRFSASIYSLDNRNHTARVRDKKRPTYTKFLKWLEDHPEKDVAFEWPEDKSIWLNEIFAAFPEVNLAWIASSFNLDRARKIKEKYNGDLITTLTGLKNKDLGNFIKKHHASFESKESFNTWVFESSQSTVENGIMDFKNSM